MANHGGFTQHCQRYHRGEDIAAALRAAEQRKQALLRANSELYWESLSLEIEVGSDSDRDVLTTDSSMFNAQLDGDDESDLALAGDLSMLSIEAHPEDRQLEGDMSIFNDPEPEDVLGDDALNLNAGDAGSGDLDSSQAACRRNFQGDQCRREYHRHLNGTLIYISIVRRYLFSLNLRTRTTPVAIPCDSDGNYLEEGSPPWPKEELATTDWGPFKSRLRFEWADCLFRRTKTSKANVDFILQLLSTTLRVQGGDEGATFDSSRDLYATIDALKVGDTAWQSCTLSHCGERDDNSPSWMFEDQEVWFRDPHEVAKNMLANPDFNGHFDCIPYQEYGPGGTASDRDRRWRDFMSGDWAWDQAVSVQVENT